MVRGGGSVWEEIEVKVPAAEAWKLYGSLQLARLVEESLPNLISKIDVVQGDGSAGTILHIFFPAPGGSYKEKFTVVDNQRRLKETEVVEGGFLDLGFTLYRVRFEIMDKEGDPACCITRSTIEYQLKEDAAAASYISIAPLSTIMRASAHHLLRNYHQSES